MSGSDETDRAWARIEATHEQQAAEDPRWEALCEGRLSVEVAEALRRESPDRFELYRPFNAAEQERVVEGVLVRMAMEERARRRWRIVAVVVALAAVALGALLGAR